jgi:hypothetical protein
MKQRIFTLIAIICFALSPFISEASHFRYGHITWTRTPGTRTVTFTVTTAWRYDLTEYVDLDFGDGTSQGSVIGNEILYVPNDYRVYQAQVTHTYATDGPFTVSFNSCCRISTLQNGADDYFTVSSIVCLANNNLGSPAYTSPVIIEMNSTGTNQFQLVTSEPDGSPISYSTVPIQSTSYVPTIGSNVASVSSTGVISWNTTGTSVGQLYQMKVTMSDGCAKSEIDFIIKIVSCPLSSTLTGTQSIVQGQSANLSLTFNGTSPPWTYRLSGTTTDVTTSTSPTTITVTPSATTTYTVTSLSGSCGVGTPSGSATVTVTNPISLVSCLPLNGNANDQIGSNNASVIANGGSNSYTTNRNGTANSALSISNGSYVEFPTNNLLNNTFTHSVWVSPSSLPADGSYSYISSIGGIGYAQDLYIENIGGSIKWVFTSSTNAGDIDVKYPATINVGQWYHLTIVKNATALQLYVNGVLVQSTQITAYTALYASNAVGRLGTKSSGLVYFFNGKIDDVRLIRGALSSLEIASLYNATLDCPTVGVPLISLTNIVNSSLCKSQTSTVNFQQNGVTSGSTYTVQLSDASGSFTSPTSIGTGTVSPIQVTIPSIITAGTGYRIRMINGTTISTNSLLITILPTATATITGTATITEGSSTNLTLNFTGTSPWTYSIYNGQSSTSYTSSTSTATQSVSPITTTTYTLSSVSDNVCGVGTGSGSAVITVVPALQLLACYKFDGNALDSKGNHHGTVNGATLTTDRFGKANAAYNFDGSSNIQLSNPTDFGITTFTWSAWVNASVLATLNVPKTIFSVGNSAGDQHINMYYWDVSGQAGWNYGSYISPTTGALPYLISYNSVSTNNWVHIVIVRTATERKMYINGQLALSYTAAPAFYSTPILAAIGSRYNGVQPFSGKIDDVKIYRGTLTDEEVLLLYNEEQGECSAPCSGMIYSLGSGSWNTPATWSCGRVPDLTDKVLIKSGHTVTIPTNDAKAKKLVNNGQVSFANSTSRLTFGNGAATPISLILQPGPTDGKDAEVSSYNPTVTNPDGNYTNLYAWTIGGGENIKRVYFGYDLSSIPTNAVIDSAFFSLYFSQAFVDGPQGAFYNGHTALVGDNAFYINRVTGSWAENTINWNNKPAFSTVNQVAISPFAYYRQDYTKMNVKNLVADMVANPSTSFGFVLRHQVETPYKITIFTTSEEAIPAVRPKLQVYYHLP